MQSLTCLLKWPRLTLSGSLHCRLCIAHTVRLFVSHSVWVTAVLSWDSASYSLLHVSIPPSPGPFRCLLSSADPMCVSISTPCGFDLHEDFALQLCDCKLLKTMGYFFWKCHKAWSSSELPGRLRKAHRKRWPLDLVCCYLIDSWMLVYFLGAYQISRHLSRLLTHFWQNSVTGSLSLLLLFFLCLCRNSWFFLY